MIKASEQRRVIYNAAVYLAVKAWVLVLCGLLISNAHAQDGFQDPNRRKRAGRIPDVMYVPTPHDVVLKMLELAQVRDSDVVYDLGCGDGRILVAAAKRYGCRAVGIDVDPLRVQESRRNVRENQVQHLVTIVQGDLFELDLSGATVVTLYLSTKYNTKLIPQLKRMKSGSRIVSHMFGVEECMPEKVVSVDGRDGHKHTLRLWAVPLRLPGQ